MKTFGEYRPCICVVQLVGKEQSQKKKVMKVRYNCIEIHNIAMEIFEKNLLMLYQDMKHTGYRRLYCIFYHKEKNWAS
jgi:hypothetical protein